MPQDKKTKKVVSVSPAFSKVTKENQQPNPVTEAPNKSEIPEESMQHDMGAEEEMPEGVEESQAPEENVEVA